MNLRAFGAASTWQADCLIGFILIFLILFKRQSLKCTFIFQQIGSHLSWEKLLLTIIFCHRLWWHWLFLFFIERDLRHLVEFFEKFSGQNLILELYEYFELILLCKVSHIYLRIIKLMLKLSLYSINHQRFGEFTLLLGLNVQLNNIGRLLTLDDPQEKL